jgi:hypothetical protein
MSSIKGMYSDIINFLSGNGRWHIVMLEAYLDESGTHKGAPVLCVAGYWGNRQQWGAFEKEWFPKIEGSPHSFFHAENSKCDQLRLPLAEAIDKGKLKGIICSTKPGTFNYSASEQLKSQMGDAYAVCAVTCAWIICQWSYDNKKESVSFAYETGRPNADFVNKALIAQQRLNDPEVNIANVSMVKKEECPHIATADFLSHVYGSTNADDIAWYDYLVRNGNILYTEITSDKLNEMSKLIKDHYINQRRWKELKRIMRRQEEGLKPNDF